MKSSKWQATPNRARGERFAWVERDDTQALLIEQDESTERYEPVSEEWYEVLQANAGRQLTFDALLNAATMSFNQPPSRTATLHNAIDLGAAVLDSFAAPPRGTEATHRRLVCAAAVTLDESATEESIVRSSLPVALRANGLDEPISWAGVIEDDRIGNGDWHKIAPDSINETLISLAASTEEQAVSKITEHDA